MANIPFNLKNIASPGVTATKSATFAAATASNNSKITGQALGIGGNPNNQPSSDLDAFLKDLKGERPDAISGAKDAKNAKGSKSLNAKLFSGVNPLQQNITSQASSLESLIAALPDNLQSQFNDSLQGILTGEKPSSQTDDLTSLEDSVQSTLSQVEKAKSQKDLEALEDDLPGGVNSSPTEGDNSPQSGAGKKSPASGPQNAKLGGAKSAGNIQDDSKSGSKTVGTSTGQQPSNNFLSTSNTGVINTLRSQVTAGQQSILPASDLVAPGFLRPSFKA
ncbi:MAG: hypothetical protein K2X66_18525 [Cyanobacteria bacterium]|nr:hypothetical protein [Cyanobacteriota bacterium]